MQPAVFMLDRILSGVRLTTTLFDTPGKFWSHAYDYVAREPSMKGAFRRPLTEILCSAQRFLEIKAVRIQSELPDLCTVDSTP